MPSEIPPDNELTPVERLNRDLRQAAVTLTDDEARFLVDAYYSVQEDRKRSRSQERSLEKGGEPHAVITWFAQQNEKLEADLVKALDSYTDAHLMGPWMKGIYGIGPVLSAGLLAHIDITRAPTVGHIWAYAGWAGADQKPWERGEKRPWNATLKTILWRMSDVFVKFSNNEKCFYGLEYRKRKDIEERKNAAGDFAETAAKKLLKDLEYEQKRRKPAKEKVYHAAGQLSPGHLDLRARRVAVKLFLSHLHGEWYLRHYGVPAPLPYPIAFLGHAHIVRPPSSNGGGAAVKSESTE